MPRNSPVLLVAICTATLLYIFFNVQWHGTGQRPLPNWRDNVLGTAPTSNFTVNVVVASLQADDISWTSKIEIPNVKVIRYISDNPTARFRPIVPRKGREALIYHTYFYDFYDDLPDLSIMIHAHEDPWHIEGVLQQSMLFTLGRLDLQRAHERGYANLRVNWENACPAWLDTTKKPEESVKQEEPYMREAFERNFGPLEVPRILAGPCCSQFVVTRDAIRRHPRSQYKRSANWLVQTDWSDYIAGRTWEHMFPWLFRGEATDCPVEWKTYCSMYGICFEEPDAPSRYNKLWQEKRDLMEATEILREILDPQEGVKARQRMREIDDILRAEIIIALERGKDERLRSSAFTNIFDT